MADLLRMGGVMGIQKDKLGSPSTGSEDGGGIDLAELVQELDHDEFDGPALPNGKRIFQNSYSKMCKFTLYEEFIATANQVT